MKRFCIFNLEFWIVIIALLMPPASLQAHPGRLDKDGCHTVDEDWIYKDGRVLKAGDHHCHRKFGEIKFDGKERLEDPGDAGKPKEKKHEK